MKCEIVTHPSWRAICTSALFMASAAKSQADVAHDGFDLDAFPQIPSGMDQTEDQVEQPRCLPALFMGKADSDSGTDTELALQHKISTMQLGQGLGQR